MSMLSMNADRPAVRAIADALTSLGADVHLVDVGASGGLDAQWAALGGLVRADAFEPLVAEVERLSALGTPNVAYHCAFLVAGPQEDPKDLTDVGGNMSFGDTSAMWFAEIAAYDHVQEVFNQGSTPRYSDERTTLDAFLAAARRTVPAMLKIDTDGGDLDVLRGATRTLANPACLAVQIEVQLHGPTTPNANTFANIDVLLRSNDFTLVDLDVWRYSRRALPAPFAYGIPAQTVTGGVQWGDALYLRDPGTSARTADWLDANPIDALRLALVAALYGQADLAALVLDRARTSSPGAGVDWTRLLDALVPANPRGIDRYEDYLAWFRTSPRDFLPEQWNAPRSNAARSNAASSEVSTASATPSRRDGLLSRVRRALR